jgi:hypothetical protein
MVTGSIPVAFKSLCEGVSFLFSTTSSSIIYLCFGSPLHLSLSCRIFAIFVLQISEGRVRCDGMSANGRKGKRVSETNAATSSTRQTRPARMEG